MFQHGIQGYTRAVGTTVGSRPLSSEHGTNKTTKARFWPCLSRFEYESPYYQLNCSLLARQRAPATHTGIPRSYEKNTPLGPCSRNMPRELFLVSEVPLYLL